mmetsp:Transcript_13299/g.36687  ORF Transcript_13299/g.36687 Transcript_13299/m.36687 type:complete len:333 (-) Transcript_13299:93-1091(-)
MEDKSDTLEGLYSLMDLDLNFGDRLQHILGVLDGRLEKNFFHHGDDAENNRYPAVDLASGKALFPLAYAQHYSSKLEWYPTEQKGFDDPIFCDWYVGEYVLSSLSWFLVGSCHRKNDQEKSTLLFTDSNGVQVREGDMVQLTGLSNASYNGTHGLVQGFDTSSTKEERVAVRLFHRSVPLSFKSGNLKRVACKPKKTTSIQAADKYDPAVIQGLLDRARFVDLLNRDTWSKVMIQDDLQGRCALVTCTSLLTSLGYREPEIWKDCLELASRLLTAGGYFLQYDTASFGKFGHGRTMKAFIEEKSLGLVLEGRKEEEFCGHGKMYIMLWRKQG